MYFSSSILPPALLDLTLLRVAGPANARTSRQSQLALRSVASLQYYVTRNMHQAALSATASPPAPYIQYAEDIRSPEMSGGIKSPRRALKVRSGERLLAPMLELEKRIRKLGEVADGESSSLDPPHYTEDELMGFYEDVLAVPSPEPKAQPDEGALRLQQAEKDLSMISAVEQRLMGIYMQEGETISPSTDTAPDIDSEVEVVEDEQACLGPFVQPYWRVLTQAHEMVNRIEAVRARMDQVKGVAADFGQCLDEPTLVPLAVLLPSECEALVRVSIQARDWEAAELALSLMKRTRIPLPRNAVTEILEFYANAGDGDAADKLVGNYISDTPTEQQRHLHVGAHLRSIPPNAGALPTSALTVLHHYESLNIPAPMHTYTGVISYLFSSTASLPRAQAWDLFSHMRYIAHPDPDVFLYALMIRGCANPISPNLSSEPEKAMDLWTEMTIDHRITPTRSAYNAIILACAKSGEKRYVNEAFRLARQMLDGNRDAHGMSAYRPDRQTFCALLEGAKRIGDLGRVRWILAEMIREEEKEVSVDEEVMMHVMHAYASYRPPFQRSATNVVREVAEPKEKDEGEGDKTAEPPAPHLESGSDSQQQIVDQAGPVPSMSLLPPQSSQEIINEISFIFRRILNDTASLPRSPSASRKFADVVLTPRLLASYLAVFYKHASLQISRELFWNVFDDLGVQRSARAYVEALERCAIARRGTERQTALKWSEELWDKWKEIEAAGMDGKKNLSARMVEKANMAMVRVLSLTKNLDRAMDHLREYAARYPPNALRIRSPKPLLRSTRTALVGPRPLVRMTSSTEVPDDHVPPLLMFNDVEVLHSRLVETGRSNDIRYLKWLCKSYEWALRVRRDEAMKAKPNEP